MPKKQEQALTEYLADHDVLCPECEYNLRGLTSKACPECGTPVTIKSLKLGKLIRGLDADIIRWGCYVSAAGSACAGVGALVSSSSNLTKPAGGKRCSGRAWRSG